MISCEQEAGMVRNTFVVYAPPAPLCPFLAVMILPTGKVEVEPFGTSREAESHNRSIEFIMYGPGDA
jgi:hypothetical protein